MFTGINVPAGSATVTPAIDNALVKQSTLAQPMGIIVTPNTGITNLTKAQVTALMGSATTDWSNVDFFAVPALAAGPVIVCKRTAGSGTQASINDFFFGYPCHTTSQTPAAAQAITTGGAVSGYTVIENNSSGALATCMTAAQQGTAPGYTINITNGTIAAVAADATHVTLPAGGRAIGLMGLDRPAGTTQNAGINGYGAAKLPELYNFISINGVAPSVVNSTLGAYDVVVNNSWNKRAAVVNGVPVLAGDALTFFNAMASQSGNPAILGTTKVPPVVGVAALSNAVTLNYDGLMNADGTMTNPTLRVTKANSCQPAVQNQ